MQLLLTLCTILHLFLKVRVLKSRSSVACKDHIQQPEVEAQEEESLPVLDCKQTLCGRERPAEKHC